VAYVFVRDATGSWSEQAKLSTPEGPVGNAVAIRGDTALVASGDVACVFVRDGTGSWSQVETLFPSDSGEEISISVALGGNSALVGTGREGAVYVFVPEDRPPSDVSIIQPPDGSIFNSGADIVFQATANDPEDGDIRASTVWTSSIQEGSKTGGVFETSNLIDGVHVITATVTDSAGQTASESITITVSNNPPTVSIIQPADGSTFASGSTITFQGTATDPEDGDISDSIVWTSDIQPGSMKGSSATSEEVIDGVHVITASVTDSLGNAASDSITITVGTPQ